jgi:hypothetical protein
MKRTMLWIAVTALAVTLSGCFAFLPQGDGYLSIGVELPPQAKGPSGDYPVIIFVANADMEDSIKELLWLIDGDSEGRLNDKEEDRLTEVARDVAERGLVKFGGDPFLRTSIPTSASSGSFEIPGVPAGRSYFVKMVVFEVGADISNVENLSEDVFRENRLFSDNEDYDTAFATWTRVQTPAGVEPGKTAPINILLESY